MTLVYDYNMYKCSDRREHSMSREMDCLLQPEKSTVVMVRGR